MGRLSAKPTFPPATAFALSEPNSIMKTMTCKDLGGTCDHTLVKHHVAITSTLPVFEDSIPGRPPLRQQVLDAMAPQEREAYLSNRERPATMKPPENDWARLFKRNMQLENAFAAAGGLLLAGPDPTGDGGVVPGFGDQREIELLVEAGFSPVQAKLELRP
jgi:hypothetical protein